MYTHIQSTVTGEAATTAAASSKETYVVNVSKAGVWQLACQAVLPGQKTGEKISLKKEVQNYN